MIMIISIVVVLIVASLGAVLFLRKRGNDEDNVPEKDFSSQVLPSLDKPVQQTYQQPVVEQTVVTEPTVLRQWTDEAGYTWRAMDDGSNYWWTGSEWQRSD